MRKNYRFLKADMERMKQWRKFMKVFKYSKPESVPMTLMNQIMGWV